MYDQREKAQRDYQWMIQGAREEGIEKGREEGREEGRQEGREEGKLAGQIQILQQILGDPQSPDVELVGRPVAELASLLETLQSRVRDRNV